MPRIYIGEPWEQKYRYEARQIIKGLRISPNGQADIKGTQINWSIYERGVGNVRTKEYASDIRLHWKKESVQKNLAIIKEAVNRKINNPNQSFKEHLNNVIFGITPVTTSQTPLQNEPILTELRLIRNYLEKLTLLQEVSNG